ncbi:type IV secretion system protein [uncultured Roseibium sp.]|uniref:type IV secretion system protein n=1 Tax=uncultured Roseibium sp. TaxID=1936171 RepID=UPI002604D06A|nr:type IV secretion system protein [uncultured Roseibium sp.]
MAASACNICTIFTAYQSHAEATLDTLVSTIHGPLLTILIGIVGIWALWIGIQVFVGTLDLAGALKQVFFMVLGFGVYIGLQGGLISQAFNVSVNVMGGLASEIMGQGGSGMSGLNALLRGVEDGIGGVFNIATTIMGAGGWTDAPKYILFGVALLLPYVILLVLFLAHTAVSLFRLTVILGISPFLVGLAAFPFGRNLIAAGVRTIVGSIATMLCVSIVFSLVIASVEGLGVTGDANVNAEDYIDLTSGQFLLAMIMGWLGAALISEAVNIAGHVSSSVLGTVSAGIMSAGAIRGASIGVSTGRSTAEATGRFGSHMREQNWTSQRSRPGGITSTGAS